MSSNRILHLTTGDKFLPDFIKLVNSEFKSEEHVFLILKTKKIFYIQPYENVVFLDEQENFIAKYKVILKELKKANKVILHGLFNIKLILLLALHFRFLCKCMWVIWGGDLYVQYGDRSRCTEFFLNFIRRFIIKRLGGVISFLDDDYEYALSRIHI